MLDPATLGTIVGGLGGLSGGSKTKVTQTASSLANVALSITNLTGGENTGDTGGNNAVTPVTTTTPTASSSPTYGAFSDTSSGTTALDEIAPTSSVLNNPMILAAAAGLVALGVFAAFTKKGK